MRVLTLTGPNAFLMIQILKFILPSPLEHEAAKHLAVLRLEDAHVYMQRALHNFRIDLTAKETEYARRRQVCSRLTVD
jgi:hypothetical protein